MPTTNTGSDANQGSTPTLPKPHGKVQDFDKLRNFDDAQDYALGGYHASITRADKSSGASSRLWRDAAEAYRAAYLAIVVLKPLPEAQSFPQAKELLKKANHLADQAAAGSPSS